MQDNATKGIEKMAVASLKPHPRQAEFFSEPPPHEVAELAADMKLHGQLQPVEIVPSGIIICGHKRVAAARLLGWTEIDVWVRTDLADKPAEVERRLVEDNLYRRQLGPMAIARCYRHLKQLASKFAAGADQPQRLAGREHEDLRDQLARRLDMSGRNLDRLLRILEHAPAVVQHAVEAGRLPMTVAYQVAGLDPEVKKQIAAEIRSGVEPVEVVRRLVAKPDPRHKHGREAGLAFVKMLERGLVDLDGRVEQAGWFTPVQVQTLRMAGDVIKQLLKHSERLDKKKERRLARYLAEEGGASPDGEAKSPDTLSGQAKSRRQPSGRR
jgi:ParB-like chromosome segregation protein Spo0J